MDFIKDFETDLNLDKFHSFTEQELIHVADHFNIIVSKHAKKQIIKSKLLTFLKEKSILRHDTSDLPGLQSADDLIWIKELELEMRCHERELKEKQMHFDFKCHKLETEKEWMLRQLGG